MGRPQKHIPCILFAASIFVALTGCQTPRPDQRQASWRSGRAPDVDAVRVDQRPTAAVVQLTSHRQEDPSAQSLPAPNQRPPEPIPGGAPPIDPLEELVAFAAVNNPTLRRMRHEAAMEWAQVGYVSKLPDPTISSMFFLPPMRFVPDRQVADVQIMQMIPWLGRLDAESRRAHLEALAAENQFRAERLRVIGDIRAAWFRLYVLAKQVRAAEIEIAQLGSLVQTASARVATGNAQPGDVLMTSLERSAQQEQVLAYRQQLAATTAELNQLAGRDARIPIVPPETLQVELPEWDHDLLRGFAMHSQPELAAARMRTAATRWGIEVARLKRRPDVTFSGGWIPMDAPGGVLPEDGKDSWTMGVSTNIPLWHRKYDAMTAEASREHHAAHATEDEIIARLDATLVGLWEQARTARQTVQLYETSILPQARQTYEADQKSLATNMVAFDRVVRGYRTVVALELAYHRTLGDLATTIARIRQTVGADLQGGENGPHPNHGQGNNLIERSGQEADGSRQ